MFNIEKKDKGKIRIFYATDSPTVSTGFGHVSYELITRLLKTGRYEIISMGTNDRGEPHPLRGAKDLIIEPLPYISEDPYGRQRMPELLKKYQPDVIFGLNDIWVWTADERRPDMLNWFYKNIKSYKPYVPFVGYFCVDGRPWTPLWTDLVNHMDAAVVYSDYGVKVLSETPGVNMSNVHKIYHGSSNEKFFPVEEKIKEETRKEMGVEKDTFLIGMVCRNQPRKLVPRAIQAFKMFKDGYVKCDTCGFPRNLEVIKDCELCGSFGYSEEIKGNPDVALYLHMNLMDMRGFKLPKIINDNKATGIISRPRHNVAEGVPIEELNKIYNAMDVSLLTTTAGAFELPVIESQAAGTPVIATRTTAVTELLDDGLGYMVDPETYMIMEDANHCYKHAISMQGLIDSMEMSWRDWKEDSDRRKSIIKSGLVAAKEKTWDLAADEFDKVFQEVAASREPLHELMKKPDAIHGINLVFVSESNSISKTVSMLPALQELAKKQELNVLFGLKRRFMPLVNNKDIHTFDIDYMWLEDSELPKYKYAINAIESIPDKYENGTWPYPAKNWHRLYCEALKVNMNDNFGYMVTEAEDKKAKEMVGDSKIKVFFIADDADINTGLDQKTWKMASEFLTRFDDVTKIGVGLPHILDDMELDVDLVDARLRDIFAVIKNVDLVVVSNADYIYVANLFPDTKFLFVNSARDDSINLIHPNVEFLPSKSRIAGMPIGQMEERGRRVIRSGEKRAADVHGAEIFSKILKFRKNFLDSKSE